MHGIGTTAQPEVAALAMPQPQASDHGRHAEQPQVPSRHAVLHQLRRVADSRPGAGGQVSSVGDQAEAGEEAQDERARHPQRGRDAPEPGMARQLGEVEGEPLHERRRVAGMEPAEHDSRRRRGAPGTPQDEPRPHQVEQVRAHTSPPACPPGTHATSAARRAASIALRCLHTGHATQAVRTGGTKRWC